MVTQVEGRETPNGLLPVAVTIDPYVELRIDAPQNRSDSSTQEKYIGVKAFRLQPDTTPNLHCKLYVDAFRNVR
jgi:hypothetical protein